MRLLLPVILLLVGAGSGIGAGIFLRPPPEVVEATSDEATSENEAIEISADPAPEIEGREYVKLANQFVIPVVEDGAVAAMVLLGVSVEVETGNREAVLLKEPKLRDSFLQVLFDHANIGGFQGAFTDVSRLEVLRTGLREVAVRDLGRYVTDVLITDLARQDY